MMYQNLNAFLSIVDKEITISDEVNNESQMQFNFPFMVVLYFSLLLQTATIVQ